MPVERPNLKVQDAWNHPTDVVFHEEDSDGAWIQINESAVIDFEALEA